MINNFIIFSLRYYTYLRAFLSSIFPKPEGIKIILKARQQDIFPNGILKKVSNKNLNDFLRISQKILNKKRQLINTSKKKQSMNKQKLKTVIVSFLDNFDIKGLPILIRLLSFSIKEVDIAMIDINTYCIACKLKSAQVFVVSMRNLEY